MAVEEGTSGGGTTIIDDDVRRAEQLWSHTALSYAPSAFMPKIKVGRLKQNCKKVSIQSAATKSSAGTPHFTQENQAIKRQELGGKTRQLSLKNDRLMVTSPRVTSPNPFHLHTEERGAEKKKKFNMKLLQKELEEEAARVPKANPIPCTTDYLVIPPKPEPKHCTKPEGFQLQSLVRHEEEMQREQEKRLRMEREEAQMRKFKAQPVLKEDPIPVPEKVRKPLTQVQEFDFHLNLRAENRAQFDQKIKEKEMAYRRYREDREAARMIEEQKALKQMRRTMVPHAKPVPNFNNPFCPEKICNTTKPKSPNLRALQRWFNGFESSSTNMR